MDDFILQPHQGIIQLHPYVPGLSIDAVKREYGLEGIIKLASNENPFGPSPLAKRALKDLDDFDLSRYPSIDEHPLKSRLAAKNNIHPDNLMLANGSDLFFQLVVICFALHQNKKVLTHEFAFATYEIQSQALGVEVLKAPIDKDTFEINLDALIALAQKDVGVLFLANPNNPTGTYLPLDKIDYLLKRIPESTLMVLDEAYYEFINLLEPQSSITRLKTHPNLMITRTFSKAHGLAGLRLGYAMAHREILAPIKKVILPFSVNQLALKAGLSSLDDEAFIDTYLESNAREKVRLLSFYQRQGYPCLPAFGNFITIKTPNDAKPLFEALLKKGIIVRPLHAYGMNEYLRISIGTPEENDALIHALTHL